MAQRRQRRRRYPVQDKQRSARLRKLISLGLLGLAVLFITNKTLQFFGVGNAIRRTATILNVEERGVINVSVDGGALKRADDDLNLYAGDTIVSSPRNNATLSFFDGSSMRLDESTQVRIEESYKGEESSVITIEIAEGTLWASTPKLSVFSGAITRTIASPYLSAELPPRTEFVITPRSITVFAADGLGLKLTVAGNKQTVMIGEGQQFTLPVGGEGAVDLYTYRSPLDPLQLQSAFVEKSRAVYATSLTPDNIVITESEVEVTDDITLTVENPADGTVLLSNAVKVNGRIGSKVEKVRINGYLANVDLEKGTFEQELVLPDEDEISIVIEAVDSLETVIGEAIRTVTRDREPPEPPSITTPAGNGETYLTSLQEIEISGTAPKDAIGIEVNGYRLQLFEPGDTDWSYLANTAYNNFKSGENIFEVVAINRGGYRSKPAKLVIMLGEGQEGLVIASGSLIEGSARSGRTVEEATLPTNTPLMPGTISIYSPQKGTEYTAAKKEFLIEGNVPKEANSVWVNGYNLRLYEQGKGFFNYIASVELNTLKRGRNVYHIAIRSESGHLLDEMDYVVTFRP